MAIFGNTRIGSESVVRGEGKKMAYRAQLTESAEVTSISLYGKNESFIESSPVTLAIYSDLDGIPDRLLTVSEELIWPLGGAEEWHEHLLPTPLNLSPGYYWLAFMCAVPISYRREVTPGLPQVAMTTNRYADGFLDPFGPLEGFGDHLGEAEFSTYGTYTPVVGRATINIHAYVGT